MLVGVLSMLLMPVDYRGGAAVSHPHAAVQLISDLAGGTLDHHGKLPTGHTRSATAFPWSPLSPLTEGLVTPDLAPESQAWIPIANTVATIASLTALASDMPVLTPALDADKLTPWSSITGKNVLYALVLPPLMLLAWNLGQGRFDRRTSRNWRGISSAPEPPPPRGSAIPIFVTP